jgi:hypothetical protein
VAGKKDAVKLSVVVFSYDRGFEFTKVTAKMINFLIFNNKKSNEWLNN